MGCLPKKDSWLSVFFSLEGIFKPIVHKLVSHSAGNHQGKEKRAEENWRCSEHSPERMSLRLSNLRPELRWGAARAGQAGVLRRGESVCAVGGVAPGFLLHAGIHVSSAFCYRNCPFSFVR